MQNALKQKLDNLRLAQGWGEILIKNEEGIGIHEIWTTSENNEEKEKSPKIAWCVMPTLREKDIHKLKKLLEHLLKLVEENLVITENEIAEYNSSLS